MLKRILLSMTGLLMLAPTLLAQTTGEQAPGFHPTLVPEGGGWDQAIVTAIWTIVIFIIMLVILYPAWKMVLAGLQQREERIRSDISGAEASRIRAEQTLAEYNNQLAAAEGRVREMLAKASLDAEKIATSIRMQAQQEAEEIKERTQRDLDAARRQAVTQFREYAAGVATAAAEQILRRNLNEQDQRDLVNQSLDQLESANA